MRLLLDTHVLLWTLVDDPRLSTQARGHITDPTATIFVSAASIWEISIKHGLGRTGPGAMPISGEDAVGYCGKAGFTLLPISARHAAAVETLPAVHGDPFDWMLVAQAKTEPLILLTHDAQVAAYGPGILLV
jgi:PIN domain nuclease of toxin-antitoxin system